MRKDVRESVAIICYAVVVAIFGVVLTVIGLANQSDDPFESTRVADLVRMIGGGTIFVAVIMIVASLVRIGRALSRDESDDLAG